MTDWAGYAQWITAAVAIVLVQQYLWRRSEEEEEHLDVDQAAMPLFTAAKNEANADPKGVQTMEERLNSAHAVSDTLRVEAQQLQARVRAVQARMAALDGHEPHGGGGEVYRREEEAILRFKCRSNRTSRICMCA
jgi:DNA repair ATPase RecN